MTAKQFALGGLYALACLVGASVLAALNIQRASQEQCLRLDTQNEILERISKSMDALIQDRINERAKDNLR